jgi:hypothetical protein
MSTITFSIPDANFDDGQTANGTDVRSRTNQLKTFLESQGLDPTNNINVTVAYPWTAHHSWTVSDASNNNLALVVGAVMSANKYGFSLTTTQAQVNSAMFYCSLSNSSSTVPAYEAIHAGTGEGFKATNSNNGVAFSGVQSSTSASVNIYEANQAGTGTLLGGTLRSLTDLKAVLRAKTLTTITTADNTATETEVTDLTLSLPANFLKAGTTLRGVVWGQIDTPGAGVPTARIKLYHGGTSGTTILDSGAVTHTTSLADSLVKIEWCLTCISIGGSGTIEAQGQVIWGSNTTPASRGLGVSGATGATNDTTFTVDTTTAKDITLTFKWGSAVAGATFKARSGYVEILG